MSEQNIFTQTGANSTQIQNQINNSIFIVPESTNIRKVFFKNREIIKISAFLLKNSGSFSLVFRSERLVEVLALLTEYKLEPKRLKICFTKRSGAAKISLIEAIKAAERGLKIEPPLFVYDETGEKSEYIKNLYK